MSQQEREVPDTELLPPEPENQGLQQFEQRSSGEMDIEQVHSAVYREKTEPREGHQPVPLWLILIAFALLMWGGWYLGTYSAGFSLENYEAPTNQLAQVGRGPVEQEKDGQKVDPMLVGRRVYNSCMGCHQADGEGIPSKFPPLVQSRWVLGDQAVLVRILLHGLDGPIEVRGMNYRGQMPAWERLSDQEIAGVLTYIRNTWGNEASAVEPEFVAEVREETAGRTDAWSASELKRIAEDNEQQEEETTEEQTKQEQTEAPANEKQDNE